MNGKIEEERLDSDWSDQSADHGVDRLVVSAPVHAFSIATVRRVLLSLKNKKFNIK